MEWVESAGRMKQWKMRTRILAGFGSVILLIIALGAFTSLELKTSSGI